MIPSVSNFSLQYPIQHSYPTSSHYLSSPPMYQNPFLPYFSPLMGYESYMNLKQSLQSQFLNFQLNSLTKTEPSTPSLSSNFSKHHLISPIETPSPQAISETKVSMDLPDDPEIRLEAQIKYMVQFFVNNYGLVKAKDIQAARKRYAQDEKLLKAFDALTTKYSTTSKTREEMVKWIVRRALKTSKQALKGEQKKDQKKLLQDLCKRYFKGCDSSDVEEEEEPESNFVETVLPFRKNSKNKTMNSTFIAEIFQSEEFRQDYKDFLRDFDKITDKENNEKIRRFCRLIVECTKKGAFESVIKYKRVPWLKLWIQNTKKSAVELDEEDFDGKSAKKVKSDDY